MGRAIVAGTRGGSVRIGLIYSPKGRAVECVAGARSRQKGEANEPRCGLRYGRGVEPPRQHEHGAEHREREVEGITGE